MLSNVPTDPRIVVDDLDKDHPHIVLVVPTIVGRQSCAR